MSLTIPIKTLVLVGPSGSGRSALAFRLTSELPHKFQRVVSMTSRPPRPMEKQGHHFYFRSEEQMIEKNRNNEFVTFMLSPHNHYYGTSKQQLKRIIEKNRIPILKVTLHSAIQTILGEFDCHALYIKFPDMNELERRLQFGPYDSQQIKEKIRNALEQQREAAKYFPEESIIENKNIEEALIKVKSRLFELY